MGFPLAWTHASRDILFRAVGKMSGYPINESEVEHKTECQASTPSQLLRKTPSNEAHSLEVHDAANLVAQPPTSCSPHWVMRKRSLGLGWTPSQASFVQWAHYWSMEMRANLVRWAGTAMGWASLYPGGSEAVGVQLVFSIILSSARIVRLPRVAMPSSVV